jgi:hypothetical protein
MADVVDYPSATAVAVINVERDSCIAVSSATGYPAPWPRPARRTAHGSLALDPETDP